MGYNSNPYGAQHNGCPTAGYPVAGYGAQPYASAYAPQYAMPPARTANGTHVGIAWIFAVLTLAYTLPWAIAAARAKSNAGAIAVLNLFIGWTVIGWTVIGWIAALVMACSAEQTPAVVVAYPPYFPPTGY